MNRLGDQTSPYLLQHASNPVDWWPWCDEAFEEARRRGVPVFLSVGYAACHWCHVMERESFEDPSVAAFMNERFVCVKVDREEHPAVDAFYIDSLLAMGQPAGWPASLWLDHERMPFYGGTYFPPFFRYGTPAFIQVLRSMSDSWRDGAGGFALTIEKVRAALGESAAAASEGAEATLDTDGAAQALSATLEGLDAAWDPDNAGWGQGAKFPMPPNLELLLDQGVARGDRDSLEKVAAALDAMDRGGLHDHLGGGFHRYAVDPEWDVPHFEKMLYDNAQLLRLFARGARAMSRPRWETVCRGIVGWLMREMRHPAGGFYASQDADSEDERGRSEEGAFYTWTPAELRRLLPAAQAARFGRAYSIEEMGNFEGRSVLRWCEDDPTSPALAGAKAALLRARRARPAPPTDTKRVVGWNGLTVSGLAVAGRLLGRRAWVMAAEETAEALLAARDSEGALPRTLPDRPGGPAPAGTCQDHAFVAEGLLDLHEATLDGRWLLEAEVVAEVMVRRFYDPRTRLFYRSTGEDLPLRRPDLRDGAEPSGSGRALEVLRRLRLYGASGEAALSVDVDRALLAALALSEEPAGDAGLALTLDRLSAPGPEVILSAPSRDEPSLAALAAVYSEVWRPRAILGVATSDRPELSSWSAFAGRGPRPDAARAYVCRDHACSLPTSDPAALRALLDS